MDPHIVSTVAVRGWDMRQANPLLWLAISANAVMILHVPGGER